MHRLNSALAFASAATAALQQRLARFWPRTDFSPQSMGPCLDRALATVSGMVILLRGRFNRLRPIVGLGAIRNKRALPPIKVAPPVPRLAPDREWEMVVNLLKRDLTRIPAVACIQARAGLKIDAAEYAFNRIVADCSNVLSAPLVPVRRRVRSLAHRPELPVRRPLAA